MISLSATTAAEQKAGAVYGYKALRADGSLAKGTVTATSVDKAHELLAARGLYTTDLSAPRNHAPRKRSLGADDLALGLRILADLLESGLPVGRTLAAFSELAPPSWADGIEPLRASVREGKTLAAALGSSPLDLPPVVIGILRAGEMGTGLAPAVRRAADFTEHRAATRAAVRNALAYPIILVVAGSASIALLVGVVLPKFAVILGDLGQHVPRTTQMVLDVSDIGRRLAIPGVLAIAAGIFLWRMWTSTPVGRLQWHRLLLLIPVVGPIRRSAAAARTASAMASLLASGVPVASALVHASHASGDAAMEAAVLDARERVTRGERVSRAMDDAGATTSTVVRLLRAGEESGRLADMFAHASTIEQQRTDRIVRSAVRLLEPALILAFGGIVAFVAAALLQAVYSVRPT